MWRASLIHFSVLIFVFSTTSSIHAREIFVVLHNESDHDWALSLNVNGSLFGGHNHWPDEPDEPTDSYQSKSGEVYHTGTWREFLVFKGTTRTIKASCDCNPFRFNAGFSDKVKGTGLIGFVGRINVLDVARIIIFVARMECIGYFRRTDMSAREWIMIWSNRCEVFGFIPHWEATVKRSPWRSERCTASGTGPTTWKTPFLR